MLLSIVALAATATCHAYDYPYLTFQSQDGTEHSMAVESLVLTVADGQLTLTNDETTLVLTLNDLAKMFFADSPTGIVDVESNAVQGAVDVYSLSGQRVGRFASADEAKTTLGSGVYVVKSKSVTQKIAIQ